MDDAPQPQFSVNPRGRHQRRPHFFSLAHALLLPLAAPTLHDGAKIQAWFTSGICNTAPGAESPYNLKVARSPKARAKGLSKRRTPLAPNEGMLFLFSPPAHASFWMKETYIPLEIGFFDPQGVLKKTETLPVERNPKKPKKIVNSVGPALAAVEFAPKTLGKQFLGKKLCVGAVEKSP